MERTETAGAPIAAANLRYLRERHLCGGRLTYTEWVLDLRAGSDDNKIAEFIASAYISPDMRWKYPQGRVGSKLPPAGSARKGDFGELWAGTLYSQIVGRPVPFQRLEGKPAKKSTLQGGDLLAVTLVHGDTPQAVAVEVKYRTKIDGGVLTELTESLQNVDESYLATAWEFGVTLMERHPEVARSFAHSAAVSLARLRTPDEPLPAHERHAVILGPGTLTTKAIEKQWGTSPPVSQLHVINVAGGEETIDRLYDQAADLTYADAASGAPALIESRDVVVGMAAPVSSTSALTLSAHLSAEPVGVVEAALWMLADWDGMGAARARYVAETATIPAVRGLARLLTGAPGRAREALDGNADLLQLVEAVSAAWHQKLDRSELIDVVEAISGRQPDVALAQAIRYTGAAIAHRLIRHPRAVLGAIGSHGPCVSHIIDHLSHMGIQALWPSQAKAVGSGLLDPARPSLVLKMPTSAGKTLLIELLVADTLDTDDAAVAAILAPSRALVSQLSNDLRRRLGDAAQVRSSHGGMDFDLEDPSADGILSGHGVSVLTPERFDLEWRRATVGDGTATIEHLKLLIVDEAHLLMEGFRGAQLELVVARALRRGIRVVVLSSQFPDVGTIASWLEGKEIESDWSPAWLQRFVYFTSDDKVAGFLQAEVGEPDQLLTIDKKATPGRLPECPPGRPDESMAVAALHHADGLVIVYANERARIPKLVEAASAWYPREDRVDPRLAEIANQLPASELTYSVLLRAGIGVHHAGVPSTVRQAVERAARQNLLRLVVCTSTLLEGVGLSSIHGGGGIPSVDPGQPRDLAAPQPRWARRSWRPVHTRNPGRHVL